MRTGHEGPARRRTRALRASSLAVAMAPLVLAALAAPVLSTRSDGAHGHPPGSEPHVHPVREVFAAGPIAAPVRRVEVDLGTFTVPAPHAIRPAPPATPSTIHGARAPPARGA